jgi:RNA polymerase sigma-70 factor (ECF subfamily)
MAIGRDLQLEDLLGQREWLRRLARHLAGQPSEGDDLAQDAWLAVQRTPPDPERSARPWLAQVLRNLLRTRRRDQARRARRERAYHQQGPQRTAAVDEVYERLQLQRFVVERVMALPESLRTVVILSYFEGLESRRVAELTGTPAGTVRWRLKQALDRLRSTLDERHGGKRAAWIVLLLPETAPRPAEGAWMMASTKTKAWVIAAAGLGMLAVSGGVLFWRARRVNQRQPVVSSDPAGPDNERPAPVASARAATAPPKLVVDPAAVASEQTLTGCATALAQAREDADALDREARGLIPGMAFEAGAPNPALRAQVVPQIERIWPAVAAGLGITHAVECRGWACGLVVLVPAEDSPAVEPRLQSLSTWIPVVKRLPELDLRPPSPMGVAVQWVGSRPTRDRLTGKKLEEFTFFFGAPPGSAPQTESAPPVAAAAPDGLDTCRRELLVARQRQQPRLAQLEGFRPLPVLFGGGAWSPALTTRVQAAARRAGLEAKVECRAGICRLRSEGGPPDPAALSRLRADDEIGEQIHRQQLAGGDAYLGVREMGGPAFLRMREPLRKPSLFEGCPQPEQEGNVLLRVLVPETGMPNEDGAFDRVSVQLAGGTLAGSPAAACLTDRIATTIGAQELPKPVGGLFRFESWIWRPGQTPRLQTPPLL